MNRKQVRALRKVEAQQLRQAAKALGDALVPVPQEEIPMSRISPVAAWKSKKYVVQLYREAQPNYPDLHRLSIARATRGKDHRWMDGLSWDELMAIKREIGYGDCYAVEVYPRDADAVNDSNMRHLWLFMAAPLSIGWFAGKPPTRR